MSNLSISLIICVYNNESTISRCLDCAINQDFQDYEVILIDDGSTDFTSTICQNYANLSDKICYHRIEHGGISCARNYGIIKSSGKYIAFSDSDDIFAPQYLSFMYNLLLKHDADMVVTDTFKGIPSSALIPYYSDKTELHDWRTLIRMKLKNQHPQHQVYGKLIKRDILKQICFPEGHSIEDYYVFPEYCYRSTKIIYNHSKLYLYCYDNPLSIMRSAKSDKFLTDQLLAYRRWIEFLQDKDTDLWKSSIRQYLEKLFSAYGIIENKMVTGDLDNLKNFVESELDETYRLFFMEVKSLLDVSFAKLFFLIRPKYFIMKHFHPLVKYKYKDFYTPNN